MKNIDKFVTSEKFLSYPTNNLFGVIADNIDAELAVKALVAAGFSDEIQLYHGEEGANRIDASGAKHGLLAQLRRLHQKVTVEREHAEQYEEAVLKGYCVIAVHTSDPESRETARQILKNHGGYFINYYGRFGIRKLDL
jgi:hypothetical protein